MINATSDSNPLTSNSGSSSPTPDTTNKNTNNMNAGDGFKPSGTNSGFPAYNPAQTNKAFMGGGDDNNLGSTNNLGGANNLAGTNNQNVVNNVNSGTTGTPSPEAVTPPSHVDAGEKAEMNVGVNTGVDKSVNEDLGEKAGIGVNVGANENAGADMSLSDSVDKNASVDVSAGENMNKNVGVDMSMGVDKNVSVETNTIPTAPKFPDPTNSGFGGIKKVETTDNNNANSFNSNNSSNNNSNNGDSGNHSSKPKSKKKMNLKMVLGSVVLLLIIVGAGAGFYLTQYTQQDIRQQAYVGEACRQDSDCDAGEYCADIDTSDPYDPTGYCAEDGEIGDTCSDDTDCAGDLVCPNNTCVTDTQCRVSNTCGVGDVCSTGDCLPGLKCESSRCVEKDCTDDDNCGIGDTCSDDTDCAGNLVCPNNICEEESAPPICDHQRTSSEVATANNCTPGGNLCDAAGDGGTSCRIGGVDHCCYGDASANSCDGACYQGSAGGVTCNGNTITNNSGSSITIQKYTSTDNSCPAHNYDSSYSLGNGDSTTADCNQLDAIGYCGVCDDSTCATNPPTNPPTTYSCNSSCTSDSQCHDANPDWSCDATSNKCRLTSNPTSTTCEPNTIEIIPECQNISMIDSTDSTLDPTGTFEIGMTLRFQCDANDPDSQITNYEFRINEPDGVIVEGSAINPAGTSSTSQEYLINKYGSYVADCRYCTATGCGDYIDARPRPPILF